MVPSERTVTVGIEHGKKAARAIDAWLRDGEAQQPAQQELASYDKLNTWYYNDAPAAVAPRLDAARRTSTFDEVVDRGGARENLMVRREIVQCRTGRL